MKVEKFIYYILAAFITGTVLLIYIQYNSAKNIRSLISNNEKFIDEYNINSELKGLEKDLVMIKSNISDAISTNNPEYLRDLDHKIEKVQNDLQLLQQISDDKTTAKQIDELDIAVQNKLNFNKILVDSFYAHGKAAAEKPLGTFKGRQLMDSIHLAVQNIENTRHNIITRLTIENDKNGENALRFNTILIVVALISGAVLFWFIINTIRKRESLIRQLHESEKTIKETAKVKEQFLANMSHEIRTPMNAILGYTNLLQQNKLDEESKKYVETIHRSGESLLTIINDVLDLSKIEAGMLRIEQAPFSIRALVHSIEVMFKSKSDEKGLAIQTVFEQDVPEILEGDSTRLTQILINLIGNSIKFTNKGNIGVRIFNDGQSGKEIRIGITISDTGIGIEKDKLAAIFNRFQQADDSVTRGYGGTGLGLAIVKELVQIQGGTIAVESEPGKGTSFTLMLPYKIAEESTPVIPLSQSDPGLKHAFANIRVLVAEDNEINQGLIRQLFKRWGLEFDIAINGRDALKKLQERNYNLVLMDIQMPEMDGYTTTKEIRSGLKLGTPIIAMTAHAMAGEREKCIGYGMNDYISKPINEKSLHDLITKYMQDPNAAEFKYIHLDYLKEISGGNKEYEKTVTGQFLDAIPGDLQALETAWQNADTPELRRIAHNMKTTVSVMGLNEQLQPHLDTLEYEELNDNHFSTSFQSIRSICKSSIVEARQFYNSL